MNHEQEIREIFDKNKIDDLTKFLDKRACLNTSAQYISYLFYLLQASSIVLTSIGQTYSNPFCIWSGISIASLAGVIHHVQETNQKISKTLMKNIRDIKSGKYVDEAVLNLDENASVKKSLSNESSPNTPCVLHSVSSI